MGNNRKRKAVVRADAEKGRNVPESSAAAAPSDIVTKTQNVEDKMSKSKKKRMKNKRTKQLKEQQLQEEREKVLQETTIQEGSKQEDPESDSQEQKEGTNSSPNLSVSKVSNPTSKRPKSALQQAFLQRLSGSRFRSLNEDLYTTNSAQALQRYQENPELFQQYHDGFAAQVQTWPTNPVDVMQKWILRHEVNTRGSRQNSQRADTKLVVADFGCGEANLAKELLGTNLTLDSVPNGKDGSENSRAKKRKKNSSEALQTSDSKVGCPFTVHSFDLVANGNPLITACDMSKVPLPNQSVDLGVFCLALMGTNVADFIREAHRVLRPNGILKVAEVRSRFESSTTAVNGEKGSKKSGRLDGPELKGSIKFKAAKKEALDKIKKESKAGQNKGRQKMETKQMDDSLLTEFLHVMKDLGFRSGKVDRSSPFFLLMEFKKVANSNPSKSASFTPKPCLYKRR
jgi:ribosomal RNA-processing protein 8